MSDQTYYSVVFSPHGDKREIVEVDSHHYKLKLGSKWRVAFIGSKSQCESYQTKGQKFKAVHGYSKTMDKNMKKHGLNPNEFSDSVNAYRDIRKKRRAKARIVQHDKHTKAKALRGTKAAKKK